MAQWEVILVAEVAAWFEALAEEDWDSAEQVEDAIDMLAEAGPALGRPLVDRIKGAELHHLKELRPGSTEGQRDPHPVRLRSGAPGGALGCRRQSGKLAEMVRR
ncbi:hypothetical protein [Microbispora catharanthi]|uniref:hypothetical protein n=1 Tax=Microbispora catharanthi TaxID=1712871 RepID=UPI0030B8AD26